MILLLSAGFVALVFLLPCGGDTSVAVIKFNKLKSIYTLGVQSILLYLFSARNSNSGSNSNELSPFQATKCNKGYFVA